ncbi:MAG: hypothetical protein ACXWAC_12265 [Usitatibacter sp.]
MPSATVRRRSIDTMSLRSFAATSMTANFGAFFTVQLVPSPARAMLCEGIVATQVMAPKVFTSTCAPILRMASMPACSLAPPGSPVRVKVRTITE